MYVSTHTLTSSMEDVVPGIMKVLKPIEAAGPSPSSSWTALGYIPNKMNNCRYPWMTRVQDVACVEVDDKGCSGHYRTDHISTYRTKCLLYFRVKAWTPYLWRVTWKEMMLQWQLQARAHFNSRQHSTLFWNNKWTFTYRSMKRIEDADFSTWREWAVSLWGTMTLYSYLKDRTPQVLHC